MSTLDRIAHLLQRDFDIPPDALQPGATLESLEIDSLRLIEIFFCIEDELGVQVPGEPGELRGRITTLGDLAAYIDEVAQGAGKVAALAVPPPAAGATSD
ncbi:MAG TPA: acyl carrier protein [Usitatibacter sp.]|nr:acyl carrier protein [Usitatibacter sp.]